MAYFSRILKLLLPGRGEIGATKCYVLSHLLLRPIYTLSCPVQSPACSTHASPALSGSPSVREGRSMDGQGETDALAQKHIPSCAQR